MKPSSGVFTVSLDFELHWGGFEKWPAEKYRQYFLNTRTVIPEMLSLFAQYEIHATWASVGILFCQTKEELLSYLPAGKPTYQIPELSAYHYISHVGIGEDEISDPLHFAPSLITKIIETPHQELGSHTFAHYYCNEPGQTIDQFRDDLKAAQIAAMRYGKVLTSLVFPRNQFNDQYLKACLEEGITAVRSNPLDWFWNIESTQAESVWKRLNRGLDAYFKIGAKNTYDLSSILVKKDFPICIPASRLLRPYRPAELFLNYLKIKRIKSEMERAAEKNELYHLWWHPHNFGNYPRQNLRGLEEVLKHYAYCRDKWGMQSANLRELAALIRYEN